MKVFNYFNLRTFFILIISQLAAFLVIHYNIKLNTNVVLFGLAIAFPIAFSTQAAFKRRDRALEYFSMFKAGTIALHYSFSIVKKLTPEKKSEIRTSLMTIVEQLMRQLEQHVISYKPMQESIDKILEFIKTNRDEISNRNVLRIIRYVSVISESSTYLISLVRHRTMVGIRFYSLIFILIFPLVQAPIMHYHLGSVVPEWYLHLILAITSLILITLHNFQLMIEYPFDSKGMDNIQLRDFVPDMNEK